jgi:hypothetical protein
MTRKLMAGIAVVLVMTWMVGCSKKESPTAPTTVSAPVVSVPASLPSVSVDSFVGDWQADPVTDPGSIAEAEAAAARSCSQVEFRAVRDVDSRTATVVFAATCARVRIRAVGVGTLVGDTLLWRAKGEVTLPNAARTCAVIFGDGSKAQPAGEGLVRVAYNGTICAAPVSGHALVRRR